MKIDAEWPEIWPLKGRGVGSPKTLTCFWRNFQKNIISGGAIIDENIKFKGLMWSNNAVYSDLQIPNDTLAQWPCGIGHYAQIKSISLYDIVTILPCSFRILRSIIKIKCNPSDWNAIFWLNDIAQGSRNALYDWNMGK